MTSSRIDVVDAAFDFIDRTSSFRTRNEITREYARIVQPLGFDWFVSGQIFGPGGRFLKFGKLDQSWWSHYSERAYFDNDPMPRAAFTTKRLFTWAEIVKRGLSPEAKKLMNDAADFGHVEGFVTPIHGVNGELTTVIHMARKTDLSPKERNALHLASIYFSEVGDLLDPEPDGGARKTPQLTARQIEVLTLVARGFTREEIARRLNIAETTVTQHIENAKIKLERPTTMQSVVRALMTGQIRP